MAQERKQCRCHFERIIIGVRLCFQYCSLFYPGYPTLSSRKRNIPILSVKLIYHAVWWSQNTRGIYRTRVVYWGFFYSKHGNFHAFHNSEEVGDPIHIRTAAVDKSLRNPTKSLFRRLQTPDCASSRVWQEGWVTLQLGSIQIVPSNRKWSTATDRNFGPRDLWALKIYITGKAAAGHSYNSEDLTQFITVQCPPPTPPPRNYKRKKRAPGNLERTTLSGVATVNIYRYTATVTFAPNKYTVRGYV